MAFDHFSACIIEHKLLRFDKVERCVNTHAVFEHQREWGRLSVFSEHVQRRPPAQPRR
jgi:hypothetical protein